MDTTSGRKREKMSLSAAIQRGCWRSARFGRCHPFYKGGARLLLTRGQRQDFGCTAGFAGEHWLFRCAVRGVRETCVNFLNHASLP